MKKAEAEDLWTYVHTIPIILSTFLFFDEPFERSKFIHDHATHPLVADVAQKAGLFDEAAANFEVPPLAVATNA
jgi:hypothetical protein